MGNRASLYFARVILDTARTPKRVIRHFLGGVRSLTCAFRQKSKNGMRRLRKAAKSLRKTPNHKRPGIYRARLKRRMLRHTTFVGVTGSCGKTTTTALIDTILSQDGKTHAGM